jgi:hypothetical protein
MWVKTGYNSDTGKQRLSIRQRFYFMASRTSLMRNERKQYNVYLMALSRLSSSDTTYNALERMDNLRDFA